MAHRSNESRRLIRGPRRTTIWNEGPLSNAVQSITMATDTVVTTGQTALGGVTLVRFRGELMLWLEVVTTIGDGFTRVGAGVGVITSDAFAAGAEPSALGDPDWGGWLWHWAGGAIVGLSVTEAENTGPLSMVRIPIDSKAMRKIGPNETIFASVSTQAEVGAATLNMVFNSRMLVKLS